MDDEIVPGGVFVGLGSRGKREAVSGKRLSLDGPGQKICLIPVVVKQQNDQLN